MRDVAEMAGVSVTTVSHVINGTRAVDPQTRRRVLAAISDTGYRRNSVALALARGGTGSVGIALSALANPYLGELVTAIESTVAEDGSTVLLGETHENPDREYDLVLKLLDHRMDGILLAPTPGKDNRALAALAAANTPVVLVDRLVAAGTFDQVGSDNTEPMAQLVDHLAGHGHTRIGFIAGVPDIATTVERRAGYLAGMERNDLPVVEHLIAEGGSDGPTAARAVARLLADPTPPTAVLTGNNYMTVGVLKYLADNGISVPDDVALAGFDDFPWAELMRSPLTAVRQNWPIIGQTAVQLLRTRIADRNRPPQTVRVNADLVIRHSCGCP